ncbi:MAG: hypothetical protein A2787_05290 [Omnitrophica WOR_2 bacterium RIFCSPHIGHO2_01_FULL_48_9]|nr:MAG: hypothetical protein A3D10_04300 [Omnitrophica WOR_2 bacterium RIFCSPHIGHO2_02_FULL_48_11]OGX34020.1 MAG: hypothetical protein A2787_05290 [Omnitrophica WOR_2 bacterium RIFCSPHIGHO2_01_FULL_48_9]
MGEIKQIDIHKAKEFIDQGECTIVDIRDADTYQEAHIKGAVPINDANVEEFLKTAVKTKPLICYCYHGISRQGAAEFFKHNGFQEAYSIQGGFEAWKGVYPFVSGS